MGNLFGTESNSNIERKCINKGYHKGKNINKLKKEPSISNYINKGKKLINIKSIYSNKILLQNPNLLKYVQTMVLDKITSDTFKDAYINFRDIVLKKNNPKFQNDAINIIEQIINLHIYNNVEFIKDSISFVHKLQINNILTLYRYNIASIGLIKNKKFNINKQYQKDYYRNIYVGFINKNSKLIYHNPKIKKGSIINICNTNYQPLGENDAIKNEYSDLGEYDDFLNYLLDKEKNIELKEKEAETKEKEIETKENKEKEIRENIRLLQIQNLRNTLLTTIIKTYYDCYIFSDSKVQFLFYIKPTEVVIYICLPKCSMYGYIKPDGMLDANISEEILRHNKNYVVHIDIITDIMTIIPHDIIKK